MSDSDVQRALTLVRKQWQAAGSEAPPHPSLRRSAGLDQAVAGVVEFVAACRAEGVPAGQLLAVVGIRVVDAVGVMVQNDARPDWQAAALSFSAALAIKLEEARGGVVRDA